MVFLFNNLNMKKKKNKLKTAIRGKQCIQNDQQRMKKKKTENKKKLNFRQLRRLPVQQRTKKKKAAVSLRVHTNKLAECHTEKGNVELQRVVKNNKKKRQSST